MDITKAKVLYSVSSNTSYTCLKNRILICWKIEESSWDGKKRAEFSLRRKSFMVWLHTNNVMPSESLAFEMNSCSRGRKSFPWSFPAQWPSPLPPAHWYYTAFAVMEELWYYAINTDITHCGVESQVRQGIFSLVPWYSPMKSFNLCACEPLWLEHH